MDEDSEDSSSSSGTFPPSPAATASQALRLRLSQTLNPPLPRLPGDDDDDDVIITDVTPTDRRAEVGNSASVHIIQSDEEVIDVDDSNDTSRSSDVTEIHLEESDIEEVTDVDRDRLVAAPDINTAGRPDLEEHQDQTAVDDVSREQSHPNEVQVQSVTAVGVSQVSIPASISGQASDVRSESSSVSSTLSTPAVVTSSVPVVLGIGAASDSPADFRTPKRRRIFSPPKSGVEAGKSTEQEDDGDDDDAECCPICYENWTNSGNHRLASLKCGHLFGQSCIEKWLMGQGGKCPQCNAKAKRQDIRVIYARAIRALDTTERDRALKDLEAEREARKKVELRAAELRLQCQLAVEDSNRLRGELEFLRNQLKNARSAGTGSSVGFSEASTSDPRNQPTAAGQFVSCKTIRIWDAGKCRVMAYSNSLATLVVSQPSSSPLFPGFGIKKISSLDLKTSQYLTIHLKAIRDVAFHPVLDNGLLLSCGLDNKVKLTSLLSNTVVQSFCTPVPAWSCVWNADDQNYFCVGLQNGMVQKFDVRKTDSPVQDISTELGRSPVVSLKYMPGNMAAQFRSGGLLVGQLDRVTFVEPIQNEDYKLHFLPLEGSLTSLHVEPKTRHILASFRPTGKHPTIRHQLCEMVVRNNVVPTAVESFITCNNIQTFNGGRLQTVLSRTLLMSHPGDSNSLMVCAGEEASNGISIWDTGSLKLTQKLITGGITLDTCAININNEQYVAALTEKQVSLFKWS